MMLNNRKIVVFIQSDFTVLQNGAHSRFKNLIEWLSTTFQEVAVYSYINHATLPWTNESRLRFANMFPNVKLILEHRSTRLILLTRFKNLALTLFPSKARSILRWKVKCATPIFERMADQQGDYFFIVNYVDSMTVANGFNFEHYVIDTHDIKFLLWAKMRNFNILDVRVLARLRSEFAILSQVPALIAISATEHAVFKSFILQIKSFYIPEFLIKKDKLPLQKLPKSYQYDLVFVGSDNKFNVEGIINFIKHNHDWLMNYSIAIVGKVCDVVVVKDIANKFSNIHMLGYVENTSEVYHRSKSALSPIDGTGLKIKILDALNHGLPVFASKHSMDGLPKGFEGAVLPIEKSTIENTLNNEAFLLEAKRNVDRYVSCFNNENEIEAFKRFMTV